MPPPIRAVLYTHVSADPHFGHTIPFALLISALLLFPRNEYRTRRTTMATTATLSLGSARQVYRHDPANVYAPATPASKARLHVYDWLRRLDRCNVGSQPNVFLFLNLLFFPLAAHHMPRFVLACFCARIFAAIMRRRVRSLTISSRLVAFQVPP